MEKEFTEWFEANEKRFAHGQFDEKQIAYSAWLEGKKQALTIPAVVGQSEQLKCEHKGRRTATELVEYCEDCKKILFHP